MTTQTKKWNYFRACSEEDADYLRDESRRVGHADAIAFPADESVLRKTLAEAADNRMPLTIQGARTGITGGAVPEGGGVLNMARMDRVLALREGSNGVPSVIVEPGLTLETLNQRLASRDLQIAEPDSQTIAQQRYLEDGADLFFAPDPTETTASLGGMTACNASGACSFRYGATRRHVRGLTVLLPDAQALSLQRGGRDAGRRRRFRLTTCEGNCLEGVLPHYRLPAVKNAAGYYVADDMDLLDLWIGAEGTLGVLSAVELQLTRAPRLRWAVTAFFPGDTEALRFVRVARGEDAADTLPAAIEYFDRNVLRLIDAGRAANETLQQTLPALPAQAGAAVYVELHAGSEPEALEKLERLATAIDACGGDDEATWIADGPAELERLHQFRHAAPELVNLRIDEYRRSTPGLTKLGTDMAVPGAYLEQALEMFQRDLDRHELDYVVFGHVGDNHFHVNILPASMTQFDDGKRLYSQWARQVIDWGGTVSAEHGIGKLKTALLYEMLGAEGLDGMRAIRQVFDPDERMNRGNLFGDG